MFLNGFADYINDELATPDRSSHRTERVDFFGRLGGPAFQGPAKGKKPRTLCSGPATSHSFPPSSLQPSPGSLTMQLGHTKLIPEEKERR